MISEKTWSLIYLLIYLFNFNSTLYIQASSGASQKESHIISNPQHSNQNCKDFSSVPITQRVIQIIAIRPYRRSDLIARFDQEGISSSDRCKIDEILHKVTIPSESNCSASNRQINPKHMLTLNPGYFSRLNINWPYYTSTERQLVKRNLESVSSVNNKKVDSPLSKQTNQNHTETSLIKKSSNFFSEEFFSF